jgi:hypothetical protein
MAKNRKYVKVEGTLTNVGTSEEVALQLPYLASSGGGEIFLLRSFYFIKTGGTATFGPKLGESAAFTSGGVDERLAYTASGNNIADVYSADIPVKTDSVGKLYFRPGFSAGSDNDADYTFFFETL